MNHTSPLAFASALLALAVPSFAQFGAPHVLPGDSNVAPAAGDQRHVSIAHGVGQSLMVWEDTRAGLTGTVSTGGNPQPNFDLFAARLDDAGNLIDTTPFVIRSAPFSQALPKVAWNGSIYLVVWEEQVAHTYESDRGVFALRISTAGVALDAAPILIEDTTYVEEFAPCVASNGSNFAVIWGGVSGGADAIRGAFVDANGVVGPLTTLLKASIGFYVPRNFELAYSNGKYLVVSEHFPVGGSTNDVFGQLLDSNLVKIGAQFDLGAATNFGSNPVVASNGVDFCVAWNAYNSLRVTPVSSAGSIAVPGGVDVSGGAYVAYQLPSIAWDGASWIVPFTAGSFGNYVIDVARVDANGNLLGGAPLTIDSSTKTMELPTVSPIAGGSLVCWSDARNALSSYANDFEDLYGAKLDLAGGFGASQCYSVSIPAQTDSDLAGDATHGFLVTFLSQTQATATIAAQRVGSNGVALDAQPIALATGIRTLRNPAVAWNGALWFVAWEQDGNGPFAPAPSIVGVRVDASGNVLDASPIAIMPGDSPDVAAVGDEFLVATTHEPVNHFRYVYTRRIRGSDASFVDPAPIQLTNSYDTQVAVAAFSDRWILAWAHTVTHDSPYATIRFTTFLPSGSTTPIDVGGDAGQTNNGPALAVDGSQAMLTWYSGGDIFARRILPTGSKLDTDAGFAVSSANNLQFSPSIGWSGASFLIAFDDYRAHTNVLEPGIGDVYAAHVLADATLVDPSGLAIANDSRFAEGEPAVAGDQGRALVAFSDIASAPSIATWRIVLRAEAQAPTTYCTAKVNSVGCTPAIGWSGSPSASAGSGFDITATQVLNNKNGFFYYSFNGQQAKPFQGGLLCAKLPLRRTPVQNSGGNPPPNDCSGRYSIDFNAFIASGVDPALAPGATVDGQYWARDPGFAAPNNTSLSDAIHFVID